MRKLISILIVMLLANVSFGALYEEHFDYADEAALDAVWTQSWASTAFTLNTAVSSDGDGKSVKLVGPGWCLAQNFNFGNMAGTDAAIIVDWYVDTAGGITPGAFQEFYAPGWVGSIGAPGAGSGDYELNWYGGGYFPLGLTMVEGWNTVTVTIDGAGVLGFDVDGNTSAFTKDVGWGGLDGIRFFHAGGVSAVFDNIVIVPEPMTICLVGFGGLLLRRRKR